jgi:hypothetical protein
VRPAGFRRSSADGVEPDVRILSFPTPSILYGFRLIVG